MKRICPILGILAFLIQTGTSAVINVPAVRASSEFAGRPAVNTINGSGLGAGDTHSNDFNHMWLTVNNDPAPFIEVDLGAEYSLSTIQTWNYNEACCLGRGVNTGTLQTATTYGANSPNYGAGIPVGFSQAPGTVTNFSETAAVGGLLARYVRLNVTSNHGDTFTGLSEVRFDGTLNPSGIPDLEVVGVTASSEFGGREAINAVNNSGLFGPSHTIQPTGTMWLTDQNNPAPEITFDFGSVQPVGNLTLWNYNEVLPNDPSRDAELLGRGINEVDILVSNDNITYTPLLTHNFAIAPGDGTVNFGEFVPLNTNSRYVRLDVQSNHGNAEGFTGISEIAFGPIPEPSTGLLLGVCGVALLSRRRR